MRYSQTAGCSAPSHAQVDRFGSDDSAGHWTIDPPGYQRPNTFRPLALPQISFGDGQPFMKGYSDELLRYNISPELFFTILDDINVAIIPNPENQVFQKAARITGYFVPGIPHAALLLGRIAAGTGSAVGLSTMTSRVLARANTKVFLPQGLEIYIGTAQDVMQETGFCPPAQADATLNQSPESRIAMYGESLAQISIRSNQTSSGGRNDKIASMGKSMSAKEIAKDLEKAQEDLAKGKFKKTNRLEAELRWLIVRQAHQHV